jgi:hypothetical protein
VTLLSVFRIERSATGATVFVSVELLLSGFGSVTPCGGATTAVFTKFPVRSASGRIVIVKFVVPAGASMPDVKFTVFVTALKVAPFEAETNVTPSGRTSLTVAPVTVLGPLFVTVTV